MADVPSRYGGTFAGACQSRWPVDARQRPLSAAARTLRRKEQRQHTKKCLRQALTFAVVAKRSGIPPQSMVIANDLKVLRESLYGAHSGPSPDNVCPHLDAPHDYAMSGACTSFRCNTGATKGYQSSCVQLDSSLKFSLEESDLQVSGSECEGSLRCDLQEHLSKLVHDKGALQVLSSPLGKGLAPEAPPSSKAEVSARMSSEDSPSESSSGSSSDSSSDNGLEEVLAESK